MELERAAGWTVYSRALFSRRQVTGSDVLRRSDRSVNLFKKQVLSDAIPKRSEAGIVPQAGAGCPILAKLGWVIYVAQHPNLPCNNSA